MTGAAPNTFPHYAIGWAWAGDAPFQWTKQIASHFGGTRNGMVVHWPNGIKAKNEVRTSFAMRLILLQLLWKLLDCPSRNQLMEQNKPHLAAYHFCIHLMMRRHPHNILPNILKCLGTGPSIMTDGLPVPVIPFPG